MHSAKCRRSFSPSIPATAHISKKVSPSSRNILASRHCGGSHTLQTRFHAMQPLNHVSLLISRSWMQVIDFRARSEIAAFDFLDSARRSSNRDTANIRKRVVHCPACFFERKMRSEERGGFSGHPRKLVRLICRRARCGRSMPRQVANPLFHATARNS